MYVCICGTHVLVFLILCYLCSLVCDMCVFYIEFSKICVLVFIFDDLMVAFGDLMVKD